MVWKLCKGNNKDGVKYWKGNNKDGGKMVERLTREMV